MTVPEPKRTVLVTGTAGFIDFHFAAPPPAPDQCCKAVKGDSLRPVAPYRVVNIGNSTKVPLMAFISEIDACIGLEMKKNFQEIQKGDVPETWADCAFLHRWTRFAPNSPAAEGVRRFVDWCRDYYRD